MVLAQVEHNRGLQLLHLKRLDAALAAFRAAESLRDEARRDSAAPGTSAVDLVWTRMQLAVVHLRKEEHETALEWVARSLDLAQPAAGPSSTPPEQLQSLFGLKGKILTAAGKPREGLIEWNRAYDVAPDKATSELCLGRAEAHFKLEQYEPALADAHRLKGPLAMNWPDLFARAKLAAASGAKIRLDENLAEQKRRELSRKCDDLALDLLIFADEAGYLKDPARRKLVVEEKSFESLHEREKFQRLLDE